MGYNEALMAGTRKKKKTGGGRIKSFLRSGYFKVLVVLMIIAGIAGGSVLRHYYTQYATIIDRRLSGEVFKRTAKIYATPFVVYPGQEITLDAVLLHLRRAGFIETESTPFEDSVYHVVAGEDGGRSVIVSPKDLPDYRIEFAEAAIGSIVEVLTGFRMKQVDLPAELVTNLFDDTRTKRRLIEWEQLPSHLTDAIIASEDQRFYRHFGIDLIRAAGAAVANFRGLQMQGASTLTMQVAGSFFLNRRERTWNRKLPEIFMALLLETRLTKQQVMTLYVNEMYLGNRGSFAIHGFGEGAASYFGKEVADLTLAEAATLVAILPAPSAYSPRRNLERATERRNLVLNSMYELDMINMTQLAQAQGSEIQLAEMTIDASEAPYMVDYIREELLADFSEEELINGNFSVYTTLDPDLQRAAVDAVAAGIAYVDEQLEAQGRGVSSGRPPVQATLIVIDPHSGEIKAMVGGRDYSASQYNRITEAFRQPGSIFKPIVYATAFETAFDPLAPPVEEPEYDEYDAEDGFFRAFEDEEEQEEEPEPDFEDLFVFGPSFEEEEPRESFAERFARLREEHLDPDREIDEEAADGLIWDLDLTALPRREERGTLRTVTMVTPVTTVMDEPTLFVYEDEKYYEPSNYKDVFHGMITVREALQRSLNVPTVKIAERVGFERVADLAGRLGLNANIRPYPSIALGSFEITPIEMVGAYTAFANEGVRVAPRALKAVVDEDGETLTSYPLESEQVISPQLAYLMTHLLQGVINNGTGVGVRSRGFTLPAAGKTGTSRDGWFAGYTKNLLAIAWVGFDDNRELDLEGSRSALPIWTAFMKRAYELYPMREIAQDFGNADGEELLPPDPMEFYPPPGVEVLAIDETTLATATPYCVNRRMYAFIYGTVPTAYCPVHSFLRRFSLGERILSDRRLGDRGR